MTTTVFISAFINFSCMLIAMAEYSRRKFLMLVMGAQGIVDRTKRYIKEQCEPTLVLDELIGGKRVKVYEGKFSRWCGKTPDRIEVYDTKGNLLKSFDDWNNNREIGDSHKDKYTKVTGKGRRFYSSEEVVDENGARFAGTGSTTQKVLAEAREILRAEATPEYRRLKAIADARILRRIK